MCDGERVASAVDDLQYAFSAGAPEAPVEGALSGRGDAVSVLACLLPALADRFSCLGEQVTGDRVEIPLQLLLEGRDQFLNAADERLEQRQARGRDLNAAAVGRDGRP